MMNRRARPVKYQSPRDYVAANFASRTMRWTGIIVLLFLVVPPRRPHVGLGQPRTSSAATPYHNVVASLDPMAGSHLFYIVANLALCLHLFHGGWSLFQSLGVNNPRFNQCAALVRRWASPASWSSATSRSRSPSSPASCRSEEEARR